MKFDFPAALDTKGIPALGQLSLQGIALFYQRYELDLAFGLCLHAGITVVERIYKLCLYKCHLNFIGLTAGLTAKPG